MLKSRLPLYIETCNILTSIAALFNATIIINRTWFLYKNLLPSERCGMACDLGYYECSGFKSRPGKL